MDSGVWNLLINMVQPTRVIDGYFEYRDTVTIRIGVESLGSTFKEVVLVDPASKELLGNDLCGPSQLILYAIAHCTACATVHVPGARRRCEPFAFFLSPDIRNPITVLMSFDDFNTRVSRVVPFKIPRRFRRPVSGEWSRCADDSLMYVPSLILSSR